MFFIGGVLHQGNCLLLSLSRFLLFYTSSTDIKADSLIDCLVKLTVTPKSDTICSGLSVIDARLSDFHIRLISLS